MKKRGKRFDEGGAVDQEAEDKAAGLEASKGEDVGFLGRMRMGNIDDPSSEAYKRFGAGRGAAARAARVPVEDRTPVRVSRAQEAAPMDELEAANAREPINVPAGPKAAPARASAPAPTRTAPAPAKAPAKASVTEDDMAKFAEAKKAQVKADAAKERQSAVDQIPTGGYEGRKYSGEKIDSSELGRNISNTLSATGGLGAEIGAAGAALRGAGAALRGGKAATTGRALATSETPVTFLGRTGRSAADTTEKLGATRARSEAPFLKEIGREPTKIGAEAKRLEGAKDVAKEAAQGETKLLGGPKEAAKEVTKKAEKKPAKKDARAKVTNPLMWGAGPKKMDQFAKGGSVKGWGMARSARAAKIV